MSDSILERIRQHEADTRTRFHTVERNIDSERVITKDLVEALHVRLDRWEKELSDIKAMLTKMTTNGVGHGG